MVLGPEKEEHEIQGFAKEKNDKKATRLQRVTVVQRRIRKRKRSRLIRFHGRTDKTKSRHRD